MSAANYGHGRRPLILITQMANPYSAPENSEYAQAPADQALAVRTLKIITIAMAAGVLVFMAIALVTNQGALDGDADILSWIAIGFAGLMFVNHLVIPGVIATASLGKVSTEQIREADEATRFSLIFPTYQIRHIVACALLEGAAFFNVVAYMMEPFGGNLAAAGILIALIAVRIPTVSGVTFWVQDRAREIEMRQV